MNQINFKSLIIILITASCCGFIYNYVSNNGIPLIREKVEFKRESDNKSDIPETTIEEPVLIDISRAYQLFTDKEAIFIDARDKWDYNEGHILGALNFPEYRFDMDLMEISKLKKDTTYVIYCGSLDCDLSKKLGLKLSELGFDDLKIMDAGWGAWLNENYPAGKN